MPHLSTCASTLLLTIAMLQLPTDTLGDDGAVLLADDFSDLRPGLLTSVVGAHTEYHYLPEAAAKGNWTISTFRSSVETQRAWRVVEAEGRPAMHQSYTNKSEPEFHPTLVAGDDLWSDYTIEVEFTPESDKDQSGIAFRYRNDRCNYFFGVDGQLAVLKLVRHATAYHVPYEKILTKAPCTWTPGERIVAKVKVEGPHILAELSNGVKFELTDETYSQGRIALVADVPTLYHRVSVTTDANAKRTIDEAIAAREKKEAELQAANPKPVLWKKFSTVGFGVGRNLRFGDLDGDGKLDVLIGQVRHHGPKDSNSEISCLTAMTFEGKKLWQVGEQDAWHDHLTSDVAFQIHDLDGDGRNEVIYASGLQLTVLDGKTGKKIRQTPTPDTPEKNKPPQNKFSQILGDSIYFCDLQGIGRDSDLIIKDRYSCVWVLDDKGQVKWQAKCNTGHYPYAEDIDGDGKDELMVGYTLFDDDGSRLWSLDDRIKDHADGVALVQFRQDAPFRLLCAASDEGLFFADKQGNVLKHHYLGHVQNPAIADFRPDLPGLEAVSINFWGNQGIVHFYDSNGEIIHDFEPCQHGSMALPINWTGKPGEYFVLSADVRDGGLFDGWGRRVVKFPADGHPDQCNAVLDLTGDCRDEIVVWDPYEIWVYTQDDNPLKGDLCRTVRNPLYNYSNYQTTVSMPVTEP